MAVRLDEYGCEMKLKHFIIDDSVTDLIWARMDEAGLTDGDDQIAVIAGTLDALDAVLAARGLDEYGEPVE